MGAGVTAVARAGMTAVMCKRMTSTVETGIAAGINVKFLLRLTFWSFPLPKMYWFWSLELERDEKGKVSVVARVTAMLE